MNQPMEKIWGGFLIFLLCAGGMACGNGHLALLSEEAAAAGSAHPQIFRHGDEMPREVLAGVYPGDSVQLEVRELSGEATPLWSSSNPVLGQISQSGELKIQRPGAFQIYFQAGSTLLTLQVYAGAERPFLGEEPPGIPEPSPISPPAASPEPSPLASPAPSPSASPGALESPSPQTTPSPLPSPAPTPPASPSPEPSASAVPDPVASDPFMDEVSSFQPGPHAGFGSNRFPEIVLGAPRGAGAGQGSFDVLSLGQGGTITLKSATPILNEPGPDFIVFENAFFAGGNPEAPFAEPGEVAVSQDGTHFLVFPCEAENTAEHYPGCAGVHPVYANSETNTLDPTDPAVAGGDSFDLETVGVPWAYFIRIRDLSSGGGGVSAGFDLDAISIIHQ